MAMIPCEYGGGAPILIETVSTVVANIAALGNADVSFTIPSKTGYTFGALIYSSNNKSTSLFPYNMATKNSTGSLSVHNFNNAALTNVTIIALVIYIKND